MSGCSIVSGFRSADFLRAHTIHHRPEKCKQNERVRESEKKGQLLFETIGVAFFLIYINALSILNPYYIRSGSTIHFAVVLCVSASAAVVDMVDVSAWLCNYASLCITNFHSFYFFVIFVFSVHLLFLLVIFVLIQCTSTFFVVVSLIYICSSSTLKREGITGVDDGRFKSRTVYSLFSFLQFYGVV